jgi:hypothetical protein
MHAGTGIPGIDGLVLCSTTWDPDGTGPLGSSLVLGGHFRFAGDRVVDRVAAFDPATGQWQPLGAPGGVPLQFAVLPNGTLIAAGDFVVTPGAARERRTAHVLAIPSAVGLIGTVQHQQVVPLDLSASGAILALTATNRVTLTIGTF